MARRRRWRPTARRAAPRRTPPGSPWRGGGGAVGGLVEAGGDGAPVAVATYGGEPRNPALFAREVWPLLGREMSGDRGARAVLARHPELVTEVPCDDVANPADVDTEEDLRRLEERLAAPGCRGTIRQRRDA